MKPIVACLGGFCASRDCCAHYHSDHYHYVERLCGEVEEPEPLEQANEVRRTEPQAALI